MPRNCLLQGGRGQLLLFRAPARELPVDLGLLLLLKVLLSFLRSLFVIAIVCVSVADTRARAHACTHAQI